MKLELAPSILNADFASIGKDVKMLEEGGAHWLHLDIMDNNFVPNLTFGPSVAKDLIKNTAMPAEAHLMVKNPLNLIEGFAKAGCKRIMVHCEGELHLHKLIQTIESFGLKPGVVINPATSVSVIEPVLGLVDIVLAMTVNPGFGGQKFIGSVLPKISQLAAIKRTNNLNFKIEVDGGINEETLKECAKAGADTFVIGSAIFGATSPKESLKTYLTHMGQVEKELRI